MGKRNFNFQFEKVRRAKAKIKRDKNNQKLAAKGPSIGAALAAKMYGRAGAK